MRPRSSVPVLFVILILFLFSKSYIQLPLLSVYNDASQTPTHRTAVMFAFNEASTEDAATLSYFLDAAVWPSESIDFFIIVNGEYCSLKNHPKLNLPNVKYMQRENEGFDFAAYNYALSSFELSDYAYFIFLNSGVRGPLLPKHQLQHIKSWPSIFTSMFTSKIKLVGPTISCEQQVHLQSHFFALDSKGLQIVWDAGVFKPSESGTFKDLIIHSEFGLTNAIMSKGYAIDSLMTQYSDIDWLSLWSREDKGTSSHCMPIIGIGACNGGKNPTVENFYGSEYNGAQYSIQPLEVVFAKRGGTVRKLCTLLVDGKRVCNYDSVVDDTCAWTLKYLGQHGMNI